MTTHSGTLEAIVWDHGKALFNQELNTTILNNWSLNSWLFTRAVKSRQDPTPAGDSLDRRLPSTSHE